MISIDQCLKDIKIEVFYNPDAFTHDIRYCLDQSTEPVVDSGYESRKDSLRLVKIIKMKLALQKFIRLNNLDCDLENLINHNLYDYLFQNKLVNDKSKIFKFTVRKTLQILVPMLFSKFPAFFLLEATIRIGSPENFVNHFLPYPPSGCRWINVHSEKFKLLKNDEGEIIHDSWIEIFQRLRLKTDDGYEYYLHDINGELWLACTLKMSPVELKNFFRSF